MPPRRITEPSMPPSMAKAKSEKLRTGWTTGACSAAAAKAAAIGPRQRRAPDPRGHKAPQERRGTARGVPRRAVRPGGGSWAEAVVVKDAGDDPDVTDGAHLTVRVSWKDEPGLDLDRGDGVGLVTKPGLGLEVGGPAINETPRRMISYSVGEVLDPEERGVRVVISVPGGEGMAEKTTNARLGIVGGISILGTTGHRPPVLDRRVGRERRAGGKRHGRPGARHLRPLDRRPDGEGRHAPPAGPRRGLLCRGG